MKNDPVPKTLLRALVIEKAEGRCALCDRQLDPDNWHLGHNLPRVRGGKTVLGNLIALHPRCNLSMSTNTLAEAKRFLK